MTEPYLVACVGPQPGAPRVVRAGKYPELLKVFGLMDPVPAEFRAAFATAWRALAEGVPRVYLAPDASSLALMPEPLVVTGATAVPEGEAAGPRLYLFDPPEPRAGVDAMPVVPEGMVGLWPWVSAVLPGTSGPVPLPPSALAAGLYATGALASTYAADPIAGGPPPPEGWVRLVPAGKRRLLHLDPAPPRPGSPFPIEDAGETELMLLWAESRDAANPVESFTRALHGRYGAGVRVFLEDAGVRVSFPPPAAVRAQRGVTLRIGRR